VFIFGCYGILIKSPEVQRVNCDAMIFQCYYSAAVASVSFLIWLVAGSSHGLTLTLGSFCLGLLWAGAWTVQSICCYNAIQAIGYAVGPAVWIGVSICVSFAWGVAAFGNPVEDVAGAAMAIVVLILGIVLVAASSGLSRSSASSSEAREPLSGVGVAASEDVAGIPEVDMSQAGAHARKGPTGIRRMIVGLAWAFAVGILNGSTMVPMTCFSAGCSSISISAYEGTGLAPIAFLPSVVAGILVMQPLLFVLYFARSLASHQMPAFHFRVLAVPGILTGAYWGMGNFAAMFAAAYLGQTIGYPLTQTCLILNGLWGILYYKEISGPLALSLFVLGSCAVLGGAALDGKFG